MIPEIAIIILGISGYALARRSKTARDRRNVGISQIMDSGKDKTSDVGITKTMPFSCKEPKVSLRKSSTSCVYFSNNPVFIDIETTGLHSNDGIVSLAMLRIDALGTSGQTTTSKHLIFDPMKKSHPMAESVHGIDDWIIRHQELFGERIDEIEEFISRCDAMIFHNASFDLPFLKREFEKYGRCLPERPVQCTMEEARAQGRRASLTNCAAALGLERQSAKHDAYEDAVLCMRAWLSFLGCETLVGEVPNEIGYENLSEVPARPETLPRRDNKKKWASFSLRPPGEVS